MTTLEADDALAVADRLIGAIRADGLGVAGWRATRAALARGQVATLLLDPAKLVEEARAELVRLAARADAAVELVAGHEAFGRLGGVGALLRYRLDWPPNVATIIHSTGATIPGHRCQAAVRTTQATGGQHHDRNDGSNPARERGDQHGGGDLRWSAPRCSRAPSGRRWQVPGSASRRADSAGR